MQQKEIESLHKINESVIVKYNERKREYNATIFIFYKVIQKKPSRGASDIREGAVTESVTLSAHTSSAAKTSVTLSPHTSFCSCDYPQLS